MKNSEQQSHIMNEKVILFLEEHIPELASAAVKQAYWQALASGSSVRQRENDNLVEVFPDGSRKIMKLLPPQTPVLRGQRLERSGQQKR